MTGVILPYYPMPYSSMGANLKGYNMGEIAAVPVVVMTDNGRRLNGLNGARGV